jgi:hypothetical protein
MVQVRAPFASVAMQYSPRLILVLLLAAASAAAPVRAQPPADPSAQSVARLQNFGTLCAFLNLASGTVRLVVVVQPSDAASAGALAAVRTLLEQNSSKRLRAYVVWSKLTPEDTEMRALSMANQARDRRLVHFWDGEAQVAGSFRTALESGEVPAVGVLLLYDTDARMSLTPPAPSMWMSVNPKLAGHTLDTSQLAAHTNTMVRRVEARISDGAGDRP